MADVGDFVLFTGEGGWWGRVLDIEGDTATVEPQNPNQGQTPNRRVLIPVSMIKSQYPGPNREGPGFYSFEAFNAYTRMERNTHRALEEVRRTSEDLKRRHRMGRTRKTF